MSGVRRTGVLIATAAAMTFAAPAVAHAASSDISVNLDDGNGWVHDAGSPLFDMGKIAPGWSATRTLHVRNDIGDPGTLSLSALDIVNLENGCDRPEAVVDHTCNVDEGELSKEMVFSVFVDPTNTNDFPTTPQWSGTLDQLASAGPTFADDVPGHSVWGLKIVSALPWESGNETQTDQVAFTLRLTLASDAFDVPIIPAGPNTPIGNGSPSPTTSPSPATSPSTGPSSTVGNGGTPNGSQDSVEVEGTKVVRNSPSALGSIVGRLPFTGSETERLVMGSIWMLLAGSMLLLLARTRRKPRTAPHN